MRIQPLPVMAVILLVGCSDVPGQSNVQDNVQSSAQTTPRSTVQDNIQSSAQSIDQSLSQANAQVNQPLPESPQPISSPQSPQVALASYLNQSGAILYDAENCTYCRKQQRMFGSAAFQQLRVVNCGPWDEPDRECRRLGIRTFPTWEIGGRRYSTILPLDEIAEISGFNHSSDASEVGDRGGSQ